MSLVFEVAVRAAFALADGRAGHTQLEAFAIPLQAAGSLASAAFSVFEAFFGGKDLLLKSKRITFEGIRAHAFDHLLVLFSVLAAETAAFRAALGAAGKAFAVQFETKRLVA